MPRYAPTMSQSDLRQMLVDEAIRNDYVEKYGSHDPARPDMTRVIWMLMSGDLLKDVLKDWSKIDFSTENLDVVAEKTTAAGVPCIQMKAGGDWENPLICIIYFDGKKIRGYVPKDGNTYNHKTKCAFGNDDGDADECVRQFGDDCHCDADEGTIDVEPDVGRIERDIDSRIEAKGAYTHVQGKIVSKAKTRAAEQAQIESRQDLSGPITADMVYAVISLAGGCSYVEFELRSSRRKLRVDEGERLVGVPARLEKTIPTYSGGKDILWYSPMGCYPARTHAMLEAAGFMKAPDNDISAYQDARTVIIGI